MLSVKHLVKVYKSKGGVEVRALDDVSVDFPETGMVFLLGKSGSGKSTLLNMAGGLDAPDSGEIIVKGRSSKDFSRMDFDSYRNTFVGFIFQEYNILNEFNVEQNIALALQLQGKKNDKAAVEALLEQVDLKGLGKRKPNTLSGGQKQRIAIARALIKEPEIIMADEPTGALDSRTGQQVFETLKKLSETKLVIVVSHDRDFAEKFGDRIIELKDGKILSDTTKEYLAPAGSDENVNFIGGDTVRIKDLSKLSDGDFKEILTKMRNTGGEGIISFNAEDVPHIKEACKIGDDGSKEYFGDTDTEKIAAERKQYDGKKTKFIKSHLPGKRAIKIGLSGLKTKPIRLLFTILLCVVAFTMFGVLSTMMAFNPGYTMAKALEGSNYDNIALLKEYGYIYRSYKIDAEGNKTLDYEDKDGYSKFPTQFGVAELAALNNNSHGLVFAGVFDFSTYNKDQNGYVYRSSNGDLDIRSSVGVISDSDYYTTKLCGFTDCGADMLNRLGFTVIAGAYPTGDNQVMLSDYMYEVIKAYGLNVGGTVQTVSSPNDLVGKEISIGSHTFEVSGVVRIPGKLSAYDSLKPQADGGTKPNRSPQEEKEYNQLKNEFEDYLSNSFHTVAFVSGGFYEANRSKFISSSGSTGVYPTGFGGAYLVSYDTMYQYNGETGEFTPSTEDPFMYGSSAYTDKTVRDNPETFLLWDMNGNPIAPSSLTLNESQVYVSLYDGSVREVWDTLFYNGMQDEEENYYQYLQWYLMNIDEAHYSSDAAYDMMLEIQERYNQRTLTNADMPTLFSALHWYLDDYTPRADDANAQMTQNRCRKILSAVFAGDRNNQKWTLEIAGCYAFTTEESYGNAYIISDNLYQTLSLSDNGDNGGVTWESEYEPLNGYTEPADAKYDMALTISANSVEQVKFMLADHEDGSSYAMTNEIYETTSWMTEMIGEMKLVFLIIGCVVGVFAALMLFNFITVSISAKSKEIGILRAVGARGTDVFKIFFSESGCIAAICFLISSIASYFVCNIINSETADVLSLKLLEYGALQVGLILAISLVVSLLATLLPVYLAARKSPVESIRAL